MAPNAKPDEEFTMRVLTLNCWGVWLGAKMRRQRMEAIVRYLRENYCDIVFLQEIWVSSDFEFIRNSTQDIYKFAHLFRSGSVLGSSGIVILSKWMPRVVHFEPYSLNGSPFYPWHGDWFAGKGIAYSRVDFDGLALHLFSTHTHAYYKENEPVHDQYSVHRVCQSYQLARFITFISDTACNRRSNGKDLLIVAGDMNSTSSELPYKILTTMAGLTDCFKVSRYNNPSSNIIHRHRLLGYAGMRHSASASGTPTDSSHSSDQTSFFQNKFGDSIFLEKIESYKNKIAQVLFDSDTDDEDITYCHPRNSFTPNGIEYKSFKHTQSFQELTSKDKKNSNENISHQEKSVIQQTNNNNNNNNINNNSSGAVSRTKRSRKSPMKRIDFILCSLLTHGHCVVDRIATESKDPTMACSLSDHEPVMVELKICDVSHDLMKKNHIMDEATLLSSPDNTSLRPNCSERKRSIDQSRPLASVVDAKVLETEASHIEETTDQWLPEKSPVIMQYQDCNIQVLEETQSLLRQYHQYNRSSKTQMFYIVLLMIMLTLPTTTYYALANELIPMSTIVFMWLAASFLFAVGLLIGFLSYRLEQGAIEAILNDINCKMCVAKERKHNNGFSIMQN